MDQHGHTLNTRPRDHLLSLGLLVFLLLLTLDGALRKWVFTANEQIVFVVKDAVLALLVAAALQRSHSSRIASLPGYVKGSLLLYAIWVLLNVFNPSSPGLLVGLWGLKAHLLYAGLIIILPTVFRSVHETIGKLELLYPLVVIPVSVLALVQVGLGADSWLNQHVRGGIEGISYFGEQSLVRVAGPFSYITGMAAFVQVTSLLGVGLYLAGCRSWAFLAGLMFAAAALPVTGSRGVLYAVAAGSLAMIVAGQLAGFIRGRSTVQIIAVVSLLGGASLLWQAEAWTALQERIDENTGEGLPRAFTVFTNAFAHIEPAGLAGFGTGTANFGAVALAGALQPFSWFPSGTGFEEESGRIVLELGMMGWMLSLVMRLSIVVWAFSMLRSGRSCRVAAVIAFPFVLHGLYAGNGVFAASYMAVSYWFVVALLAVAQREHSSARRAQRVQPGMSTA